MNAMRCTIHNIKRLGFSGLQGFDSGAGVFLGGQVFVCMINLHRGSSRLKVKKTLSAYRLTP